MTEDTKSDGHSRRDFLAGAGAAMTVASASGRAEAATTNYQAQVFPISQPSTSGPYPEQSIARYSAAAGQWGVAFSGGGPRAFSAALGQMRGLRAAGVVDDIGAISCVSGGTWFGATYTFAPSSYSDITLLGPLVAPANITVSGLNQSPQDYMGSRITLLNDELIALYVGGEFLNYKFGLIPFDKLYSRSLNDAFLLPYGLNGTSTLFTLNQTSLSAIQARNPSLKATFQMPRSGRPFFIGGGTQIYQSTQSRQSQTPVRKVGLPGQVYRAIEYTPLYTGAARLSQQSATPGVPYGGGYVESFAFDTPTPTSVSNNVVSVAPGTYPFLLSDVLGSSSAAIAAYVAEFLPKKYASYDPFPNFDYWPVANIGKVPATTYDFGDGGILENTGVVALLRRGYKTIFAFVNTPFPVNSTDDGCVNGIDGQISRLFGLIPKNNYGNSQSTQVFATSQFAAVAQGLKTARAAGQAPVYASTFPVIDNNKFGISPYTPKIFWIYNDINMSWFNKLQSSVQALFTNSKYNLSNFPNYATVFQNEGDLLYLSPTQVNLLAHMWAYTVTTGFSNFGYAFGYPIR